MKPEYFFIAGIVLIVIIAIAASKKKGDSDYAVPEPAKLRTDLLYGYFGTYVGNGLDQVEETKDHVNLVWLWDFLDPQSAAVILSRMSGCFGVLDCCNHLFERRDGRLQPRADAEARLIGVFQHLRDAGMLNRVKMLVPVDEPNIKTTSLDDKMPWAADLMRKCAASFPELDGVLLGCVYSGWEDMPHIGLWDVVGLNFYKDRERIFAPGGKYHQMRAQLRPEQRTMIFPGGYAPIRQDPAPFVAFAHANPEVLAVIAFLWPTPPWAKDVDKGIADMPDVREKYVAAGLSITGGAS